MSEFNPNAKGGNFEDRELIPSGAHAARCARVIEIGIQASQQFEDSNRVIIVFSIPSVLVNIGGEDKQAFISNPWGIPLSTGTKSKMFEYALALDPNKEVTNLGGFLNRTAQVFITHEAGKKDPTKIYANLKNVSPLLPGYPVGELDTVPMWLKWSDPDPAVWNKLPDFQKNKIKEAVNYRGSFMEEMVRDIEGHSDLPM